MSSDPLFSPRHSPLIRRGGEGLLFDWVLVEPLLYDHPVINESRNRALISLGGIYAIVFGTVPFFSEDEFLVEMLANVNAGERLFAGSHRVHLQWSRQGRSFKADLGIGGKVFGSATEMAFRSARRYTEDVIKRAIAIGHLVESPSSKDAIDTLGTLNETIETALATGRLPTCVARYCDEACGELSTELERLLPNHRRRIHVALGKIAHEVGYELCAYADLSAATPRLPRLRALPQIGVGSGEVEQSELVATDRPPDGAAVVEFDDPVIIDSEGRLDVADGGSDDDAKRVCDPVPPWTAANPELKSVPPKVAELLRAIWRHCSGGQKGDAAIIFNEVWKAKPGVAVLDFNKKSHRHRFNVTMNKARDVIVENQWDMQIRSKDGIVTID